MLWGLCVLWFVNVKRLWVVVCCVRVKKVLVCRWVVCCLVWCIIIVLWGLVIVLRILLWNVCWKVVVWSVNLGRLGWVLVCLMGVRMSWCLRF